MINLTDIPLIIENLGVVDYQVSYNRMYDYTINRDSGSPDLLLLLEHNPVFTLGLAGNPLHIINPNHNIEVIKTDRGGQVTYHANGQLIIYPLLDLARMGISVRQLVDKSENLIIKLLETYNIEAIARKDAPGVYVGGSKIASLGYKIKLNRCYHGISLNVNMDLTPFNYINPCGYANMQMTMLSNYVSNIKVSEIKQKLTELFIAEFY